MGVPEKEAQDAAEALSSETTATKVSIQFVERKMIEIKAEINIIKWMIGLVIVIDALTFLKNIVA